MKKKKKSDNTEQIVEAVIEGIQEKKGRNILSLNLTGIENSVGDYFIICDGDSSTQVEAIADSVEEVVRKKLNEKVWHKEGAENAHWLLMDYATVIVHIFQKQFREYYNLENLWADAQVKIIESRY
jgi:ribosome-associated protein